MAVSGTNDLCVHSYRGGVEAKCGSEWNLNHRLVFVTLESEMNVRVNTDLKLK